MITSNINYEGSSCSTKNVPEIEVKAPGIFEQVDETNRVLTEIMDMLDLFKREIRGYDPPKDEHKELEPTCFKDAVCMLNSKAYAIKGDLSRLTAEFK